MTSPAELLTRVEGLIDRARALRFHVPQDTGFLAVDPVVVQAVLGVLGETAETLRAMTLYFDEGGTLPTSPGGLSSQDVGDLAFVGRTEVVELRDGLALARERQNSWKIAAEGDRAVARATRTLVTVEASLRELMGLPARERKWFDLDDALEIRRQYAALWLAAVAIGSPGGAQLVAQLKRFSDLIAILRREKVYPLLRIDDRLELRNLQKRIFAFLEDASPEAEQNGRRLWQDLFGFLQLLMHVQRREELREHDRLLIGRSYREVLDAGAASTLLPTALHEGLKDLAALDPELDQLLIASPARPIAYKPALERLRAKLWGE
jgi:hypothetical protein